MVRTQGCGEPKEGWSAWERWEEMLLAPRNPGQEVTILSELVLGIARFWCALTFAGEAGPLV